jgi:hypothetical protein
MKTMSDNTTTHGAGGYILTAFGWIAGFIGLASMSLIPIILSSIASLMAIVNYWYQIKKNKPS